MSSDQLRRLLCMTVVALTAFLGAMGARAAPPALSDARGSGFSAAALYNDGNLQAREGRVGRAILDYERAGLLAPRDPDIRANLERVRSQAGLVGPQPSISRYGRLGSPDVLYWLGVAGLALAGTGVTLLRFSAGRRRTGWGAVLLGLPLCLACVCDAWATWPLLHAAVVLNSSTAGVSPVEGAEPLFTLREGQVVAMHEEFRGYVLVATPEGRSGWVGRASLGAVVDGGPAL